MNRIRKELGESVPEGVCPKPVVSDQAAPAISLLHFPDAQCAGPARLAILGPNFSGSLDSFAQLTEDFGKNLTIRNVCLVSISTTDSTNGKIAGEYSEEVGYARLAASDWEKLRDLDELVRDFKMERDARGRGGVALLTEASTFGYGVCNQSAPEDNTIAVDEWKVDREQEIKYVKLFCGRARRLYFPASIADVRYGLDKQNSQRQGDLAGAFNALPKDHLPLELGAENGSEYPESSQSELTSASIQLSLDTVLNELRVEKPAIIVVVATEVRDRLFLFQQLREKVPRAMLVDLEADALLSSPEFLYATRGALALASANLLQLNDRLFGCETDPKDGSTARKAEIIGPEDRSTLPEVEVTDPEDVITSFRSWSSDTQGILFDTVSRLHLEGEGTTGWSPPAPCVRALKARRSAPNIVTLRGFHPVNPAHRSPPSVSLILTPLLKLAVDMSPVLGGLLAATWIAPLARRGKWIKPPVGGEGAMLCYLVILLWLGVELGRVHGNYSVLTALVGIGFAGIWGLYVCSNQLQQSLKLHSQTRASLRSGKGARTSSRPVYGAILSAVPALIALIITVWLALNVVPAEAVESGLLSANDLLLLGLNMQGGLAYYVVAAVGVFTMLYVSMVIATIYATAARNDSLLVGSATLTSDELVSMMKRCSSIAYPWGLLAILLLVLASILSDMLGFFGGVRLTVFGPWASRLALLVLAATTAGTLLMTFASIAALRRVREFSAHVHSEIRYSRDTEGKRSEIPGLWQQHTHQQLAFATTPASAALSNAGDAAVALVRRPDEWAKRIGAALSKGVDDTNIRYALFALFATEISLFRWAVIGGVLCAMASVVVVYLFPVEADVLLLVNLASLTVLGLVCGYGCMMFEGDEVLSNVLCNRSKKVRLSTALFALSAAPFVALAVAFMVIDIPGVVDWGDGILALIHALGLHP